MKSTVFVISNIITAILVANTCYISLLKDPKYMEDLYRSVWTTEEYARHLWGPHLLDDDDDDDNNNSNNNNKNKTTSPNSKRNKYICEEWPPSPVGMPLNATFFQIDDGAFPPCLGTMKLLRDTFDLAKPFWNTQHTFIPKKQKQKQSTIKNNKIHCHKWPTATIMSPIRLQLDNKIDSFIKNCWHEENGAPFIIFPAQPPHGSGTSTTTALTLKHGLARLSKEYTCNTNNDNDDDDDTCIVPETFRITDHMEECRTFFSKLQQIKDNNNNKNQTNNSPQWVKKAVSGYGGAGVSIVQNVDKELIQPFGQCNNNNTSFDIKNKFVVQRYIQPLLMDGYGFHVRTFFLYKIGSKQPNHNNNHHQNNTTNTNTNTVMDPPQAWFIKVGNVNRCSEPYSKIDDPILGSFAVKCNIRSWEDNPRFKEQGIIPPIEQQSRPFPNHLTNILSKDELSTLIQKMEQLFRKVAQIVTKYHMKELEFFNPPGEIQWIYFGADILIDSTLRPWLIELNQCPSNPLHGDHRDNTMRNPYKSILRIILTHYRREMLSQFIYHENSCADHEELKDLITRVL